MATRKQKPNIRIIRLTPGKRSTVLERFIRRPAVEPKALKVAAQILEAVRKEGDKAVARFAREFDGSKVTALTLKVQPRERAAARRKIDDEFKRIVDQVLRRVTRFAKAGLRQDWQTSSAKGGILGEQFVPMDRVGVYVPGGVSPLVSSVLMSVPLAKVAGVPEVIACTPARKDGSLDPHMLYALEAAGTTEIYKVGGIQAIGAMAYGTRAIKRVRKIVGPGGPYVTAAKKLVYGDVALDMVAGPSEIAILADGRANPRCVAADLLSQAEHGTGSEKTLLVTNDKKLAEKVKGELLLQADSLPRKEVILDVLFNGSLIVLVDSLDAGMDVINQFAPEHFELLVEQPRSWLRKVKSAGAVFVGPWTPEVAGDFAAGPSHVLPTGGAAHMFSGLTADDFRKRTSIVAYTQADLKEALPIIRAFSKVEELPAHGRSAEIRFEK